MKLQSIPKLWRQVLKFLPLLLFCGSLAIALVVHQPNRAIAQDVPTATVQPFPSEIREFPPTEVPELPPPLPEIRGVWLTSNDTGILLDRPRLQDAINQLGQMKLNTLYPVVWNSGYALYPSLVAQRAGIPFFTRRGRQGYDPLVELITAAHKQEMLVIPWFEFGFMVPPSSELAMQHPDWLTQKQDGGKTSMSAAGEVAWLNPFHPEVQQFITDLVLELLTQYEIDGVQFDDHTSLPNTFGYDRYTTALYRQETKRSPHPDPQNPAWVKWRADKLTAFMTRLNQAIKAQKRNAIVSVSPTSYDVAYKQQLQDWLTWVQRGIVDELIVQVYQYDLSNFLAKISRSEIQITQRKIPTGVGVLTGLRTKPVPIALVQAKVQAARHQGLGVSFFYYESLWERATEPPFERRSALRSLFPTSASRFVVGQNP